MKSICGSVLNSTNNRLESINGKLKPVISKHTSLEDSVQHFFIIATALMTERDHKAALTFQKVKIHSHPASSSECEYSKLLTSYALSFVLKQMKLSERVKEMEMIILFPQVKVNGLLVFHIALVFSTLPCHYHVTTCLPYEPCLGSHSLMKMFVKSVGHSFTPEHSKPFFHFN